MRPIRIIIDYLVSQLRSILNVLMKSCELDFTHRSDMEPVRALVQKVFDRAAATNTELVIADVLTTEQAKSTTKVLAMWTKLMGSLAMRPMSSDSRLLLY